jgi:hypothetical protein
MTGLAAAGVAAALLLGVIGGYFGAAPDQRIWASEDAYASSDLDGSTGTRIELMAGGMNGGAAISFLKFEVGSLRGSKKPARAEVRLTRRAGSLPALVELSRVPSTAWRAATLKLASAPRLGSVVASARPAADARTVTFDVTKVINRSGTYAFAVTVPAGQGMADFFATDGATPKAGLVAPNLSLSWLDALGPVLPPVPSLPDLPAIPVPSLPTIPDLPALPTPDLPDLTDLPGFPGLPTPSPSDTPSQTPSPTASPTSSPTGSPTPSPSQTPSPTASPTSSPTGSPTPAPSETPSPTASPTSSPTASPTSSPTEAPTPTPTPSSSGGPEEPGCAVDPNLVPTCGVLWGVAPGAHTDTPRDAALADFEAKTGRTQSMFHAYHRGTEIFPTDLEVKIARDPAKPRLLFLNWKPTGATWAQIAKGDPKTDAYLDELAAHIKQTFPEKFFFTVHHEPENDVDSGSGSGMTPADYRAMYRYVITRLRAHGVDNLVSTMVHMAYVKWNIQSWFRDLYPGDDVVDWLAWDTYAYSDPGGYGYGDFAELMNRRTSEDPTWPGFYNYAAARHPDKPLMIGEWGVWYSANNPGHAAEFFKSVANQIQLFPRIKALVYFETPADQSGRDSRIDRTPDGLSAYKQLGLSPTFQVDVRPPSRT